MNVVKNGFHLSPWSDPVAAVCGTWSQARRWGKGACGSLEGWTWCAHFRAADQAQTLTLASAVRCSTWTSRPQMPGTASGGRVTGPEVDREILRILDHTHAVQNGGGTYLSYNRLPLWWRVFTPYPGHLIIILGVVVVGECVSSERTVLLLNTQNCPSISCVGYIPSHAEKDNYYTGSCWQKSVYACKLILRTDLIRQREPHTLLLQKRPPSGPSSAGTHWGLQPAEWNNTVSFQTGHTV